MAHKSAAVPFVNQKGERSMKRVKVERYVAGKKPSYAQDDEDEVYTTDEEDLVSSQGSYETDHEDETDNRLLHYKQTEAKVGEKPNEDGDDEKEEEEEEDDDPRFRRLKQLENKSNAQRLLDVQTKSHEARPYQSIDEKMMMADEDEEEQDIKLRHALARAKTLEEPIGPQAVLGEFVESVVNNTHTYDESYVDRTEDIFKDFKLTRRKKKKVKEEVVPLEREEDNTVIIDQLHKKIEEDNKRELEREALSKGISATKIEQVNTDDEDDEIAYEEWKLREIKRVQRDRSERVKVS